MFEGAVLGGVIVFAVSSVLMTCFAFAMRHCWNKYKKPKKQPQVSQNHCHKVIQVCQKPRCKVIGAIFLGIACYAVAPILYLIGTVVLLMALLLYISQLFKKELHTVVMALFPDLITKKVYTQKIDVKTRTEDGYEIIEEVNKQVGIVMEEGTEEKEVYLFGDKEYRAKQLPRATDIFDLNLMLHGYTYFYFITTIVLASLWFIAMAIENAFYRKTTTCNDINVQDNSFTCFDVTKSDFDPVPISCEIGKSPDVEVFCYLFHPNIAALGIAFSIFKLILFGVTVYFKIAIKLVESDCGMYFMIVAQGIFIALALFALPSILPSIHFATTIDIYFFRGSAVIRWFMFVLLIITAVLLIPVPWCGFTHKDTYKSMALEKKALQDSQTRNQSDL